MPDAPVTPHRPEDVNFFDVEVQECPYPSYALLRDEAPVFKDPTSGMYVITRYEDLRSILLDTEVYGNGGRLGAGPETDRMRRMRELYETDGWVPAPTLAARDDPEHKQMRAMFDRAFRPGKIKDLDPFVEDVANRLWDAFIDDGRCEWLHQFAVPLPLIVIGRQMGAKEEDIWRIKGWTDAWIKRMGRMQTEEEEKWSVEMEIEAQHYFQEIFERLRKEPDGSLISELVNTVIPEWGRTLNDNELHAEMMADTFVGGSETTTNAIAAGVMLLIQNPRVWQQLKADPERHLRNFCEEVVRLESPVQGLARVVKKDVTLHGVDIPAGSVLNIRYASGNRDERQFECPEQIDLERKAPTSHLTFGAGTHHCLGAPLARRELYYSFKTLVERVDEMWFTPGANDFRHHPQFFLRALKELHIEFKRK
jgi:cytochrome P450